MPGGVKPLMGRYPAVAIPLPISRGGIQELDSEMNSIGIPWQYLRVFHWITASRE